MRILHVNKFLYRRGGAEAYMEDVAAMQLSAGHEVAFFGMAHPENVHTAYGPTFPAERDFEAPAGAAGKARSAARMLWSTAAKRGIESVLDDFEPDVVHLHNIYHQLSPSVLRPLPARRIPAVMTLHDYKLVCPTYQFLDKGRICTACLDGHFRHAALRRCRNGSLATSSMAALELRLHTTFRAYAPVQIFLCPSRFLAGKMAAGGAFPDRLRVLSNFVDAAAVAPKEHPGGGIVYAGRLAREKGVDTLIEAVATLGATAPATAAGSRGDLFGHGSGGSTPLLDIAGDGPERAALEQLAETRAPGQVRFHGRLPSAALQALVRDSAVVAAPSRWYENQPMAVLEAFACAVPVVATDLGGFAELVDRGVNGELVPADDPRVLASALAGVLADPDRAFAMGRAGRAKVERSFAPAGHLERLTAHYEEAARCARR